MEKIIKFNKCRAFNKAVGPGKIQKSLNVGPTFIPDYRVRERPLMMSDIRVGRGSKRAPNRTL